MSGKLFLSSVVAFLGATSCALLLFKGPVDLWTGLGALVWGVIAVTYGVYAVRLSRRPKADLPSDR
jgi:hypothetical protein